MNEVKITHENYHDEVVCTAGLILLDFYADWCGPCRMMAPAVAEIAEEKGNIKIGKVNVDEAPDIVAKFGVTSVPTFILIRDGAAVASAVGYLTKGELYSALGL